MKILIDIGHPAHVHYFRNFIRLMNNNGHSFMIIARDKEVTHSLLNSYAIEYISRGKGRKTIIGKLIYMLWVNLFIRKLTLQFKPDIFLSMASPYAAQISWIFRKPNIAFSDSEHAKLGHLAFIPFTDVVLTPNSFVNNLGKNQVRFNGYMELCYLHPNYFTPDPDVLNILDVTKEEKYVIVRFVSWGASHDIGHSGLSFEMKQKLVIELSKYARVFISSEKKLPAKLKKYQINIPPVKMHDVLSFATLYIGEGATMASECAILGIPAIYINSLSAGTLEEQEKYGLLFCFRNSKGILEKAQQMLQTSNLKQDHQKQREKMLVDIIDVTGFMVWFIENYPECVEIMKNNPDYQYNFR